MGWRKSRPGSLHKTNAVEDDIELILWLCAVINAHAANALFLDKGV